MERDPIELLNKHLVSKKLLNDGDKDKIIDETREILDKVKEKVANSEEPNEDYLFQNIYSE